MNYHNITYPDMNNGDGLRVVLWLSGCSHHCYNCQNPQTWNSESGILFDEDAEKELFKELSKDYISGITFSGGDPLHEDNINEVLRLCNKIKKEYPDKTIWLYTGYKYENIFPKVVTCELNVERTLRQNIVMLCDVLIDGEYIDAQRDITLKWKGSSNQRVIDIKKTLSEDFKGDIVLWTE